MRKCGVNIVESAARRTSRHKAKFSTNDDVSRQSHKSSSSSRGVTTTQVMTSSLLIFDALLRVRYDVNGPVESVEDGERRRKQLPRDLVDASRLSFPVDGVGSRRAGLQAAGRRRRTAPPCRPRRAVVTDVYLHKPSKIITFIYVNYNTLWFVKMDFCYTYIIFA